MGRQDNWVDHIIDTDGRLLGPRASFAMRNDPRRLAFILSRYKFCAKMLRCKTEVVEVGCGDAFGSPIVAQEVDAMLCVDIERRLIEDNRRRLADIAKIRFEHMDITEQQPDGMYDGGFSLDVLEHIPRDREDRYFRNVCGCLSEDAVFIVGVPNLSADRYASKPGHSPHVNLKDEDMLRTVFGRYFKNTFIFGMNDEVVHTGFSPMAHYLFAVGVGLLR